MLKQLKFTLLKVIDVSGLTFLSPFVRLCYGEEPRKQLADIGKYVIIPVMTFFFFLACWSWLAPKHKTKSGEVPTPNVVWNAWYNILTFHDRELHKRSVYDFTKEELIREKARVEERIKAVATEQLLVNDKLSSAVDDNNKRISREISQLEGKISELSSKYNKVNAENNAALASFAGGLKGDDLPGKQKLISALADQLKIEEKQNEVLTELKAQATAIRAAKNDRLKSATELSDLLAEEKQYLSNVNQIIDTNNRVAKVASLERQLQDVKQKYVVANSPTELVTLGKKLVQLEKQIKQGEEADFAMASTLPRQIVRSVFCVFCGFLMGTVIAIPLGILCGLSPIIMAAMTPFIALFKPVSPIVWLPIALIIVGGFIPDPDKHWLIAGYAELPLIGWLKINPAFIASAITVALCSLWATMVNTALGVSSIDKDHLNVARVLRLGTYDKLRMIVIPSAMPLIFAGLRISLGVGWMVLIAAELLASSEGIGKFVWDQFCNGASDSFAKMFVVVFIVGFIGLLLDRMMIILQRSVSYDKAVAV